MSKSPIAPVPPVDPPADPPAPPAEQPTPSDPPTPTPDEQLGAGGVKALHAEREARKTADAKVKELQAQLDASKSAELPQWQQQMDALQAKLDAEIAARGDAEAAAQAVTLAQLRTDRGIEKGLPPAAARKLAATLTGSTVEEIDTELDEWLPLLNTTGPTVGPKPNPQQGNPSLSRGGSLDSGRERFAASRK